MRRVRNQRLLSRCPVELDHPSGALAGESEDLSSGGLYVRTAAAFPVGDETDIRLTLPDGSIVALYARVVHVLTLTAARALGRHAGMGLELLGDDTPARVKLRAHIETLRGEVSSSEVPAWTAATRIVIAEPSAPLRTRMQRSLEAAGVTVVAVASATEALDACTPPPDVIVAAADMPAMTGVELAYAIAEHQLLSEVPLVLTGEDGDVGRLEAFRAGVRDYIPVPFLDEELAIRIGRVAARATGLRGSLVDIELGTLLSLLEFERKTGVLLISRDGELARIFVAAGKILKVEPTQGTATAKDRLMRYLDWRDGRFEFSPAPIGPRDELGLSVTQLLLEHARAKDESTPPQRR